MARKKQAAPTESSSPPDLLQQLAAAFHDLFRGLERAHGEYRLMAKAKPGKKNVGKALTVQEAVTDEVWEAHLAGDTGLGVVPINDDAQVMFGAIDIDKYDVDILDVEARCASMRLPLLPTRTKSGGVHCYVFCRVPTQAQFVRAKLEEWAVALGFGGSEIFPKQNALLSNKDTGSWINMPYFAAATGDTERYGIYKGEPLSARDYVERARKLRVTQEQLQQLALPEVEEFVEGPPCLQSLARSGFPEGMRNNGLFAVGVYLKKRFPDEWAQHMAAYNVRFMRPPLHDAEVRQLVKTLTRKEYNYTCDKPPIKAFCNREICRTREHGIGKGEADWGIVIDSDALKILTDPPYWIITVNGHRMQFFAEELMRQATFQQACFERIAFWPPPLAGDKWRAEVNKILQNAQEIEAPPDAGTEGELDYLLNQFCTVFPRAETREEILTGKPFVEDGRVLFRSADFRAFLDSKRFRVVNGSKLFQLARTLGVTHQQLWVGRANIHVWAVAEPKRVTEDDDIAGRAPPDGGM